MTAKGKLHDQGGKGDLDTKNFSAAAQSDFGVTAERTVRRAAVNSAWHTNLVWKWNAHLWTLLKKPIFWWCLTLTYKAVLGLKSMQKLSKRGQKAP